MSGESTILCERPGGPQVERYRRLADQHRKLADAYDDLAAAIAAASLAATANGKTASLDGAAVPAPAVVAVPVAHHRRYASPQHR